MCVVPEVSRKRHYGSLTFRITQIIRFRCLKFFSSSILVQFFLSLVEGGEREVVGF
jgi:hypothetical protein